jgi:hypothetical protein
MIIKFVAVRYRIAIWTKDAADIPNIRQIGYTFAKVLDVNKSELDYSLHFGPPRSTPEFDKVHQQYVL